MGTIDINLGNFAQGASEISSQHFGAVYSTFQGIGSFTEQAQLMGAQFIRWPGGTRGEHALDTQDKDGDGDSSEYLYNLTNDDLLAVAGKGLSDVLTYAVQNNCTFSTFLPSTRYFGDPTTAYNETYDFMVKLLQEDNGGFGKLPSDFVLEFGNETLNGDPMVTLAYGETVNAQMTAIREVLSDPTLNPNGFDPQLAIQMGRTEEENVLLQGALDAENMEMLDAVVRHHLTLNINTHNKELSATSALDNGDSQFERSVDHVSSWEDAVGLAAGTGTMDLDYYVSAWTVGDANPVDADTLQFQDYGARQAATTIDTFAQMIGAGADAMALWGVDARSNPNWFTTREDGVDKLSHGGVAYQLLSESVVGKQLLAGYRQEDVNGDFFHHPYFTYAFQDQNQLVLFLTAGDIDGPTDVSMSLGDMFGDAAVDVTRIGTQLDPNFTGDPNSDQARLHEEAVVEKSTDSVTNGVLDYTLTQDFETVRFIIDLAIQNVNDVNPETLDLGLGQDADVNLDNVIVPDMQLTDPEPGEIKLAELFDLLIKGDASASGAAAQGGQQTNALEEENEPVIENIFF